jgi:hypothetical protein
MHQAMTCCVIMPNMIAETERPNGRNENGCDFPGELVEPNPGADTWEEFLNMNIDLQKDLTVDIGLGINRWMSSQSHPLLFVNCGLCSMYFNA